MNRLAPALIYPIFVIATGFVVADTPTPKDLWIAFSAKCQNSAAQIESLQHTSGGDPAKFAKSAEGIGEAAMALVKAGELVEKKVRLMPPGKWPETANTEFERFMEALYERYGQYMAAEMMGMGIVSRMTAKPNAEASLELTLRLSAADMETVSKLIAGNNLATP